MQGEVLHIAVHGKHESFPNVGVIQAQSMSELMGCHQKQTVTWNTSSDEGWLMTSVNRYPLRLITIHITGLTLIRTEAPFLVLIVAVSGATPQLSISSSLAGAGVILFTQEHKGEVAGLSL